MFKQPNIIQYRIKKSKYGVGLFAIKKINKGDKLNFTFNRFINGNYYDRDVVEKNFNKEHVELFEDYFFSQEGKIFVPDDMSIFMEKIASYLFYLNHSDTPNVAVNSSQETVIAIKDININEEILADYGDSEYRQDGDFIPFNKDRQNLNIKYNA